MKTWSEAGKKKKNHHNLSTKEKAREIGPWVRNLNSVSLALIQDATWDIPSLETLGENPSLACQLLVVSFFAQLMAMLLSSSRAYPVNLLLLCLQTFFLDLCQSRQHLFLVLPPLRTSVLQGKHTWIIEETFSHLKDLSHVCLLFSKKGIIISYRDLDL